MVTLCQLRSPCIYKVKFDLHLIKNRVKSGECYSIMRLLIN